MDDGRDMLQQICYIALAQRRPGRFPLVPFHIFQFQSYRYDIRIQASHALTALLDQFRPPRLVTLTRIFTFLKQRYKPYLLAKDALAEGLDRSPVNTLLMDTETAI
jgi:hypothetical protein